MAGIFLESTDGGVNPASAVNSFTPHNSPSCPALFFPADCSGVITDDFLNALISEIGQAVDNAGVAYNCGRTDNLNKAIMTHGQTVGYCGPNRAAAEAQKGSPLVPGDFWLNTSDNTVYLIDASNNNWPLPNQPAAFLCCDGTQYARCGTGYAPVIGGGGTTTTPATDVTVAACPPGIPVDTDLQTAICTIAGTTRFVSGVVQAVRTSPGVTLVGNVWLNVPMDVLAHDGVGGVTLAGGGLVLPAGKYIVYGWADFGRTTNQRLLNMRLTFNGSQVGSQSRFWVFGSVQASTMFQAVTLPSSGTLHMQLWQNAFSFSPRSGGVQAALTLWRVE